MAILPNETIGIQIMISMASNTSAISTPGIIGILLLQGVIKRKSEATKAL